MPDGKGRQKQVRFITHMMTQPHHNACSESKLELRHLAADMPRMCLCRSTSGGRAPLDPSRLKRALAAHVAGFQGALQQVRLQTVSNSCIRLQAFDLPFNSCKMPRLPVMVCLQDAHEFLCALLEQLQIEALKQDSSRLNTKTISITQTSCPAALNFSFCIQHEVSGCHDAVKLRVCFTV